MISSKTRQPGRNNQFLGTMRSPRTFNPKGIFGVPDLLVEILSPASLSHDQERK